MTARATEHTATVNGLRITWLESGTGSPCLLLHGLCGDGAGTFQPVMERFADRHCFAPWARGHGRSQWADSYLIEDYAEDTAAFIDQVIGERTVIVGFSLGSMVAAYLAVHRPELVSAIFLEDSPLLVLQDPARHENETYRNLFSSFSSTRQEMLENGHETNWFRARVADFTTVAPGSDLTFGDLLPAAAIDWMASLMAPNDPAAVAPAVTLPTAELVSALPAKDLSTIACPVHLLAGQWDHGGSLPPQDLARWHELVPQATSHTFDAVGHAIRFSPQALPTYLDELDRFLTRQADNR